MREPSANRYRTALHNEQIPDGPLTSRQRAIVDAVRGCGDLADFASAPKRLVTDVRVCEVPYGTSAELAERTVRDGIIRARRQLDILEATLAAYGAAAFTPQPVPVPAIPGATRHEIVVGLLRWLDAADNILVRAGDRAVSKEADGAYRVGSARRRP